MRVSHAIAVTEGYRCSSKGENGPIVLLDRHFFQVPKHSAKRQLSLGMSRNVAYSASTVCGHSVFDRKRHWHIGVHHDAATTAGRGRLFTKPTPPTAQSRLRDLVGQMSAFYSFHKYNLPLGNDIYRKESGNRFCWYSPPKTPMQGTPITRNPEYCDKTPRDRRMCLAMTHSLT